jgi:hypothetical protein
MMIKTLQSTRCIHKFVYGTRIKQDHVGGIAPNGPQTYMELCCKCKHCGHSEEIWFTGSPINHPGNSIIKCED